MRLQPARATSATSVPARAAAAAAAPGAAGGRHGGVGGGRSSGQGCHTEVGGPGSSTAHGTPSRLAYPEGVASTFRTMLKPRWLGLLVVLLAVLVSFTLLGFWQLSVARDDAQSQAAYAAPRQPVVPIATLLTPHGAFPGDASSRRVSATGRYDAAHQVVVPQRRLDGVSGSWVVTPFVVDGTGARIAVVRGFVADARGGPSAAPAPTTTGEVALVGSVAPGESPSQIAPTLPAGQLGRSTSAAGQPVARRPLQRVPLRRLRDAGRHRRVGVGGDPARAPAAGAVRVHAAQRGVRRPVVGLRALRRLHVRADGAGRRAAGRGLRRGAGGRRRAGGDPDEPTEGRRTPEAHPTPAGADRP